MPMLQASQFELLGRESGYLRSAFGETRAGNVNGISLFPTNPTVAPDTDRIAAFDLEPSLQIGFLLSTQTNSFS